MSRVIAGSRLEREASGRKVRTPKAPRSGREAASQGQPFEIASGNIVGATLRSRHRRLLRVKGNAPGNARGLRFAADESSFRRAATESATENKPPVRADLGGKREEKTSSSPRSVGAFGKGEKVG